MGAHDAGRARWGETPGKKQIHFGKRLAREISASRSFFGLEFLRCGQFGV
jgi:hypothetical protein